MSYETIALVGSLLVFVMVGVTAWLSGPCDWTGPESHDQKYRRRSKTDGKLTNRKQEQHHDRAALR